VQVGVDVSTIQRVAAGMFGFWDARPVGLVDQLWAMRYRCVYRLLLCDAISNSDMLSR
jgi:hypothetical protein